MTDASSLKDYFVPSCIIICLFTSAAATVLSSSCKVGRNGAGEGREVGEELAVKD